MSKGTACAFAFIFGVGVGSVVTWKLINEKYKRIAQEDIDSVKEYYANKQPKNQPKPSESEKTISAVGLVKPSLTEMKNKISELGYTSSADNEKPKEVSRVNTPRVITPDEFGEIDYETITLRYYADGILADDNDDIIYDVDDVIGRESLSHFGEYEDDAVYVRNDEMKVDYEVLLDIDNYEKPVNGTPQSGADE